jgi:signal peptidase I
MTTEAPTARHATPALRVHPLRRIGGWLLGLVVLAFVALAAAIAIVPAVAGGHSLTVLSGSMVPTLPVGSIAVIRPVEPTRVTPGMVINFTDRELGDAQARIVTHRVVEVRPGPEFVTRGDANPSNDVKPVAAADVHGQLWYDVPYVGTLREKLWGPAGIAVLGGVVLLAVAFTLLVPKYRKA